MFFDPLNFRHPAFRQGMIDTLKVAPGIWAPSSVLLHLHAVRSVVIAIAYVEGASQLT